MDRANQHDSPQHTPLISAARVRNLGAVHVRGQITVVLHAGVRPEPVAVTRLLPTSDRQAIWKRRYTTSIGM